MFIVYFGKQFNSASIGSAVVGVRCDRCACEYYYELARIGAGQSTAPYNLGQNFAAEASQANAERDLQERLKSEAELVPCPKCNWINDELVRSYRRGRYRGMIKAPLILALISAAMSCLIWWFLSKSSRPDEQRTASLILWGGLALGVLLIGGAYALRALLRFSIEPNRHFPQAPVLPPGTPPALLKDPISGDLRPHADGGIVDGWHEFQIGRHHFPLVCCNCLRPATTEYALGIPVSRQLNLEIPCCAACAGRTESLGPRGWLIAGAIGLFIAGMTLAAMFLDGTAVTLAILGMLLVMGVLVGVILATVKPGLPFEAKVLDAERGVVRLRFLNAEYARLFAAQACENDEPAPVSPSTAIQE